MKLYVNCITSGAGLRRDIKELIPEMNLRRRMSRVVKSGVAAGIESLLEFGDRTAVEAVVTATGLGCIADSEKFLDSLIANEERMLNPTPFIQSTFNTVGAQIALLRGLRFDRINAAAVAAHYGSVSAGTFAVVVAYLAAREIFFESYMPLFVAILEIPAILVGILLAKGVSRDTQWKELGREIFLGKSIMLLLGGLLIGAVAGKEAIKPLEPLYTSMFKPVLAFFLLEMGLIASGQLGALKQFGVRLAAFALLMPLLGALIGALLARFMGLSLGGTAMLATLAASASYIAVPAAMRLALPEANPSLSLTASLGITFPFNILVGIPLYCWLAEQLIAWGL